MSARPLIAALALAALAGCANRVAPMYQWDDYPRQQYEILQGNGAAPDARIQSLQAQAEKARAANAALPPGFRAHLGMLQLAAGRPDEARAAWQAEKLAFPESTPYMDRLLSRLDGKPAVAVSERSAP